jgi:hypothetical protein
MAEASRDENFVPTLLAVSNVDGVTPVTLYADPVTHRLLTSGGGGGGTGTVTSVSVATANGFAGTVATATTTPAITLRTTITGLLKGNGTAISAASSGTDYVAPGAITTSGLTMATARILGRTTASTGAVEEITIGSGLSLSAGTLSATGGTGDVVGPASSTDNALARFDSTTGKLLQDGTVTASDVAAGAVTVATIGNNDLILKTGNATSGSITIFDGANANIVIDPDGTGNVQINGNLEVNADLLAGSLNSLDGNNFITVANGTGGNITLSPGATTGLVLTNKTITPSSSDGAALGTSSSMWSDLFLASGAVINFNNGELTMTQSTDTLVIDGSAGPNALSIAGAVSQPSLILTSFNAGIATISTNSSSTRTLRFINEGTAGLIVNPVNDADSASVEVLRLEGDRATPANNDEVFQSFYLSDSVGNQNEFARIVVTATTVTDTSETADLKLQTISAGTLSSRAILNATAFRPNTNDGIALGSATVSFSDLFLASGAVINFNNSNVTITHAAATLTVAGATTVSLGTSAAFTTGTIELGAASDTTISRSAAGQIAVEGVAVPTISSTNTLTNKRITPRVTSITSNSATPTINTDNCDYVNLTSQTNNITSMTTNLSGTPTDGQMLRISMTASSGTPTVTWGASFEDSTVTAPTALSTTRVDVGFVWNTATSKWRCVAKA